MKKSAILFFSALLSISAIAQNVQEGVNHLYAERYQSAKSVFDKLVAANPNNIEATYWLGQTHLRLKDTAAAASLYQKALAANNNAPLILVGQGQIELLLNKVPEARQRFETAVSVSRGRKGDDPNILNAIGRANVEAKSGDVAYAIEKLNAAAKLAPNNADVFLNLGNAYRKAHKGGEAVTNYMSATRVNPAFAAPFYRTARLYQTQQNWDVVVENLEKAIAADPKFAPAYLDLYYYYLLYPKDFAKAEGFANKYIANADPSVENDYLKAQTLFVQKKYDEAIAIGNNIVQKAGANVNPRVFRMLAYSHVEKGDSVGARQYVDQFFAKADAEDIIGGDYILQADAYAKDNPGIVMESYRKAILMDSVLSRQIKLINEGIDRARKVGNKMYEGDLRLLSYQLRGTNTSPTELISYIAVPYYQAGAFQKADSISKVYIGIAPDSIYGHLWSSRSLARIDTTMEQGLAIPSYIKLLDVAAKDKVRYKSYGVEAAGYLAGYYNNVKKDKENAIVYLKRALEFDPTNTNIQNNINILSRPAPAAPRKPATTTKPATTKPTTSAKPQAQAKPKS